MLEQYCIAGCTPLRYLILFIKLFIFIFTNSFFDLCVSKLSKYACYRYLYKLKSYVRSRSHPKGSIAEDYIMDEYATFCLRYLHDTEIQFNHPRRNYDNCTTCQRQEESLFFSQAGCALGKVELCILDQTIRAQGHRYILFNCDLINPYLE